MIKERKILSYFVSWFIVGFIIMLVGVNNVFAASYNANEFTAQLYDNIDGTLHSVQTNFDDTSSTSYYYGFIGLTANTSGGAWGITSPIPILANHTYSMTVDPWAVGCGFTKLSTVNRIGLGTSLANAVTSYQNNTFVEEKYSNYASGNILQYVFRTSIDASYIVFPYATSSSCSTATNQLSTVIIEDLGESGVSQDQINTSLNNQTNEINSSIQNSTDTITGEINDMENAIIDSNKETQEVIKDQFNSCRESENLINISKYNTSNYVSQLLTLDNGIYTVKYDGDISNAIYIRNADGTTPINGSVVLESYNRNILTFTLNESGNYYIQFYKSGAGFTTFNNVMLNKGDTPKSYEPYGEICSNKIDETNDKLNNLNGSLNDSNIDGSLGDAGSFFDNFTTTDHGGLSGIITAPLVAINQMLNTSCSPMTTTFKGKELSLPCGYEFWNKMGPIRDFVNLVLGGLLCYQIIIKLYKLIEKIKNPEDDRLEVMDL